MRLEADYAVPLYLSLDREKLGTTQNSFTPFEANDAVALHMKKWLLYCCKCLSHEMTDRDRMVELGIEKYLGNPTLPEINQFPITPGLNPFGLLFLARMCKEDLVSELQQPAKGGWLVFNSLMARPLQADQVRKFFVNILYDSFEQK